MRPNRRLQASILAALLLGAFLPSWNGFAAPPVRFVGAGKIRELGAGRTPHAAVAPDGRAYVVFARGDEVFVSSAPSLGEAFDAPVRVGSRPPLMAGMRRGPRIAATASASVVTAIGRGDGDLVAWRSVDGGASWSLAGRVNGADRSAREGLMDLAAGPDGSFHVAWLDLRGGGTELFTAVSTDGGATWTETRAYASPSGAICECCSPAIACGPGDEVHALLRDSRDGFRDMVLASSLDGGTTFAAGRDLGQERWKLAACPMAGGALAGPVESSGRVAALWTRRGELFLTDRKDTEERSLGRGTSPSLARGPGGLYAAWMREGKGVFVLRPNAEPVAIDPDGKDPFLAGDSVRGVVACWESKRVVRAAVLADPAGP
jgi:hypothetical protein